MKHYITTALITICLISACSKNTNTAQEMTIQSGNRELDTLENITHTPQIPTSGGLVCSYNPVPGTWHISPAYSNQYIHFYQLTAKPELPGGVLCGPTSYMLGAHMICASKGINFPSSKAKVGAIYNALYNAGKFDNNQGMYINDIDWFSTNYDYPTIKTDYRRTSDRSNMKEFIEYHIKSGFPVIATVNIFGNKGAYSGNDIAMYDQAQTHYYMSRYGTIGHFILLTGIKINADGSGTVWYKDPLSQNNTTRSASYTRLLDAMKYNGNDTYYDAIAIFE